MAKNKDAPAIGPAPTGAVKIAMPNPLSLLREAISAVPSVKYALGVVGIGAAISIVLGLLSDARIAVIGIPLAIAFMVVLLVFQKLSILESGHFKYPAVILLWVFPILVVAFLCLLFSSVFFNWPLSLKHWIEGERGSISNQSSASTSPSLTMVPVAGSTPYQAYRLKTLPDPIAARLRHKADGLSGYFLWEELDLNAVLFAINAGLEMGQNVYMDKETFVDNEDANKRAKLERTWSLFEGIGETWRAAWRSGRIAPDRARDVEAILKSLPDEAAASGLAILRNIYFREHDKDHEQRKAISRRLIEIGDTLMPPGSKIVASSNDRLNEAARLLATKRIQPLLEVAISNPSSEPIIITAIRLDVLEVVPAFSAMESGPLAFVDTVRFELDDKPGSQARALAKPVKIAPKDAVTVRVELRSNYLFSYLCRLSVLGGDKALVTGDDFIVDFGFQPPSDAVPLS